jgi:hypothetical protein
MSRAVKAQVRGEAPSDRACRARAALVSAALWTGGLAGCSAAIDLDPLENEECDDGFKACNDMCVPTDNPLYGCVSASCSPCAIPNATAICSASGECTIAVCHPDFADCSPDGGPDCNTDLAHDPLNCDECGNVCVLANAESLCANRRCTIRACTDGWGDCDDIASNGCEVDLTSSDAHCGECGAPCPPAEQCVAGECAP